MSFIRSYLGAILVNIVEMTFDVLLRLLRISIQIKSSQEMNHNYYVVGISLIEALAEKNKRMGDLFPNKSCEKKG